MPTYENALSKEAYKRLTAQYGDGGKRYGAVASWRTIIQGIYYDYRGYSLAENFYKSKHPAQLHYGIWDKKIRDFNEAIRSASDNAFDKTRLMTHNPRPTLVHLGSGFGGVDIQLCRKYKGLSTVGVSIDPYQISVAKELAALCGVSSRAKFYEGNFLNYKQANGMKFDGAIAIESLCHVPETQLELLWSNSAKLLKPGARFVVHDWFVTHAPKGKEKKELDIFLKGWDMPSCTSVNKFVKAAEKNGLQLKSETDLTKVILKSAKKIRFRAIVFKPAVKFLQGKDNAWFKSMGLTNPQTLDFVETSIIQKKLFSNGLIKYRQLVFEKV